METFSYQCSSGRVSLTLCWVCGVVPGYSSLLFWHEISAVCSDLVARDPTA